MLHEEFEDTKGEIIIRKSKNRQHNIIVQLYSTRYYWYNV